MIKLVIIAACLLLAVLSIIWSIELQSTVCFVLDKGGLWLSYYSGIGRLRLTGFQIRLMNGHEPRSWMQRPFSKKPVKNDFGKTIKTASSKKWNPMQVPLRSAFEIGVKVIIRELNVKAVLGIEGDAAATALLCGGIQTLLQLLSIGSTRGEFLPRGYINIKPEYYHERLSIHFKCILAIKARHIIREVIENVTRRYSNGQSSY